MWGRGAPLRSAIYIACLSAFLFFGYDQGVFSGLLQNQYWLDQFDHPTDTITGITVASYCLGALAGCIVNFCIGDIFGRRRMIWIAMGFIVVGASLQASAYRLAHLIVGRVITGVGTGIDTSTVPMYQSELSKKEWRGRLISWETWFIGLGIVSAYWIDYGCSYINSAAAWRLPIALQLVFTIVVVVVIFGCPESPRWLAKRGRWDEAREVLCAVHNLKEDDPYVVDELESIRVNIAMELEEGNASWTSVFKNDHLQTRRRVLLAYFALFMNQMGGSNLIIYYMPSVLVENVGVAAHEAQLIAGFVQLMFIVGNTLPGLALDRMGRRPTMMIGTGCLSLCMMMIAILLSIGHQATSSAAIAFFFLFMLINGATINVVPWVYGPEILPLEARSRGTAISVSSHWTWNFFIVMMTPILINRIHWKTYIIFTITNALFVPAIYFFYPETSNISLEDIDKLFLPANLQEYASRHNSVALHVDPSTSSRGDEVDHAEKQDMER